MQVAMTVDADSLVADLTDAPARTTKALVRALNRAIASARTVMVREIARDTGLKSGAVRDALPMREATFARHEARLGASLKRIPLIDFGARGPEPSRGKGRGVSYKIGTGGRSKNEHAFITTVGAGHRGVFVRKGTKRLPIRELQGPSLGHVFAKYRALGLAKAHEAFLTNFEHEQIFAAKQTHAG